ncbi:Zinc finger protein 26-like Protein [Tribolium castaneum]|uniref:Zinc finger protein 26-like Protein n=1 Tax=Tribolium castaneum TaxID=7070 RepID=D6WLW0_TRICA|nr:Zinc finger protein 26-like Protein [Tribolium castaneum]
MNVCRVCLSDKDLKELFAVSPHNGAVNFLALVQIHKNDGLPQLICPQCLDELATCVRFFDKCLSTHAKLKNHKCLKCGQIYPSHKSLTIHISRQHTPTVIVQKNHKSGQQCHICGKIFTYRVELSRHLCSHVGLRQYKCDKCGKSYITKASLNKHIVKHEGLRRFECLLCSKSFLHQDNLQTHLKTHSEKKYECRVCTKKFKSNRSLLMHLKIHANERDFPCSECEKAFVNKYDLLRHLKLHEKKRLIASNTYDKTKDDLLKTKNMRQCDQCGKICSSHGDLIKHMRVHSEERPFCCKNCNKGFKSASNLRCHERIHTKVGQKALWRNNTLFVTE